VPAKVLQPFNCTLLHWASVIGFLVFGDIPDLWTAIAAVVVIASGLYIF
jgi:drug/metabolite transporter (DMT)-like permease